MIAHGLHPAARDRLLTGVEQPVTQPHPLRRQRNCEPELHGEPVVEGCADRQQRGDDGARRRAGVSAMATSTAATKTARSPPVAESSSEATKPAGRNRDQDGFVLSAPMTAGAVTGGRGDAGRWRAARIRRGVGDRRRTRRPVREVEQMRPHYQGLVLGEVGQIRLGAAVADHLEPQFGQPEGAGQQRPYDVDGLQPGQRYAPALAGEDAVVEAQVTAFDPPSPAQPRQVPADDGERQHDARA